MNTINRRC